MPSPAPIPVQGGGLLVQEGRITRRRGDTKEEEVREPLRWEQEPDRGPDRPGFWVRQQFAVEEVCHRATPWGTACGRGQGSGRSRGNVGMDS